MTIPIARVVATRYPTSRRPRCASATSQHAYRAVRQHRGQPREILQAGIELVGAPGPEGTAEAVTVLCAALDAAGLASYQRRPRRRVAVPARAGARRACRTTRGRRSSRAGHARPGRARARAARGRRGRSCSTSPAPAAASRCSTACPEARAAARRSTPGCADDVARARDLRPRPGADARLLHRRGLRGLRRRVRRRRWAAAGATTTCSGASAARCPPAAGRWTSSACTRRAWRRDDDGSPSRAGRCSRRRSTCSTTLGIDTRRGALQRPQAALRGRRDHHDAAVRRPDLRRGGRRGPRHHRQGRAGRAGRARRLRAARPRLRRRCTMVFATVAGEDPAAEALRRLGHDADRDQVPADRAATTSSAPAARSRSSRSRARVELAPLTGMVARDRRPHRDRHDPARERPRRARGDHGARPRA